MSNARATAGGWFPAFRGRWVEPLEQRRLLAAQPIFHPAVPEAWLGQPTPSLGFEGDDFVEFAGRLFMLGDDGTHGSELWSSDGTAEGTAMLKDIAPGAASALPRSLTPFNGTLYFLTGGDINGEHVPEELWRTDGTPGGTERVLALPARPSGFRSQALPSLVATADALFFEAWWTDSFGFATSRVLHVSDGTAEGTHPIMGTSPDNPMFSAASDIYSDGSTVYVSALSPYSPEVGRALFRTDGTTAGSRLVTDIRPGPDDNTRATDPDIHFVADIDGRVCFMADDGTQGQRLWTTDGTAAGTGIIGEATSHLEPVDGGAVFLGGAAGSEPALYRTDGTAAGTVRVKDFNAAGDDPFNVFATALGDGPMVSLVRADGRTEVWATDGAESGTRLLKSFPRPAEFDLQVRDAQMASLDGKLYFTAELAGDGHGQELWKSDGTPEGTVLAADVLAGPGSAFPWYLTPFQGSLVFAAWDATNAQELWKYTPPGETPAGNDVTVTPDYFGPGDAPATIQFADVVKPGATTISATSTAPTLPAGFQLAGNYYDVSTTAVLAPGSSATLMFDYDQAEVGDETQLRLLHYENGGWADVTVPDGPDADAVPDGLDIVNNTITGRVSSFSPFALVRVVPPPVITVPIHVKSGTTTASVNLASEGVVPVTIFSTATFDARSIDVGSVLFAGAHAAGSSRADVDQDGDLDLLLKFRTQDTSLRSMYAQLLVDDADADGVLDSTRQVAEVFLTGRTISGQMFEGSDDVNLFLSGKALRDLLTQLTADGLL